MSSLLKTKSLDIKIGNTLVCQGLDFSIHPGERWGILGINGVGKTTLLHTLAGLRNPLHGDIIYNGTALEQLNGKQLAKHRSILFQDKSDPFPATVLESVLIGRHPYIDHWQWESSQDVTIARQFIEVLDLQDKEAQLINTLSGGERQRVAIAALLSQHTKLLLLDEPTNHLDLKWQIQVMELFSKLVEKNDAASVMILHDLNIAARFCNKILMLFGDGKTIQGDNSNLLNEDTLEELYNHPIRKIHSNGYSVFAPG